MINFSIQNFKFKKYSMQTTKVLLITGAAKRLGAALTAYFHDKQYNIVLHYGHSKLEAEALADKLNAIRANSVFLLQADFNEAINYNNFISQAYQTWGRLDGLIHNASSFYPTKFGEITEQQWYDLFASNAKAPLFLTQAAFPFLEQTEGSIINIIDIHGKKPLKNYAVYSTAKASLSMLTLALAQECAPKVRVNGVAPGSFIWPEGINELSQDLREKLLQKTPLQRQGTVNDIAEAVDYFLNAKFVTGQILGVDGGRSIKFE